MLHDNSLMPYGKFKGKPMAGLPAAYLLRILENNKCRPDLKQYILSNKDVLLQELRNAHDRRVAPDPFGDRL